MNTIAIIPARGGSKSIPLKNIKKFCGKPLLAWTILTALKSKVDRVLLSTEDPRVAKIARRYGAEVPFLRPAELATDTTAIEPVLLHTVNWIKNNENYHTDIIVLSFLTSPLRQARHINEALKIFEEKKADSVVSVCEATASHNPLWIIKHDPKGKVVLFNGDSIRNMTPRRQLLPLCYYRNDIVYVLKPKNLEEEPPNLYGDKVELYIMDERFDADINSPADWLTAEIKFRQMKKDTTL